LKNTTTHSLFEHTQQHYTTTETPFPLSKSQNSENQNILILYL